jgi:hypothetical protein
MSICSFKFQSDSAEMSISDVCGQGMNNLFIFKFTFYLKSFHPSKKITKGQKNSKFIQNFLALISNGEIYKKEQDVFAVSSHNERECQTMADPIIMIMLKMDSLFHFPDNVKSFSCCSLFSINAIAKLVNENQ